eukprot:gene19453-biopygen14436
MCIQTKKVFSPQISAQSPEARSVKVVYCVEHGCIQPLNVDIQDFAVNLRIREEKRNTDADKTYHGEMAKYMESLKDHGQNIEVGELLNWVHENNKHRIFFVSGVAGIGKSVLAKRIAYDWSCNEKNRHVKCLLYITCRELNEFLEKSGNEIGIDEIEKYLKEKLKVVSIEDDQATLFLIDGLDELQKPDLIQAFTKKFSQSSFLFLGRPHSRYFVDKTKERCQKLEILGLDENQIQEYIEKFDKLSTTATENQQESVKSTANLMKSVSESSANISTIISIPQFLNTICCVFNLTTEKKVITSKTDLYSWTLFLLVKQHFGSKKSDDKISIGWVKFSEYSQQLLQLCKQAFNLYISGKIIFKKTELECTDKAFIQGFLLGIKDQFEDITHYMFKHLTMMEFFASIFVYLDKNRTALVNELFKSGHYEVVSFLCSFLRFSLIDQNPFEKDKEVSYRLLQVLSDGNKSTTIPGSKVIEPAGRLITRKDAQKAILDILKKVGEIEYGEDQFLLKLRFISDCLEATDKVGDTSFLRNMLHTITPSSSVYVNPTIFEQQNLSTILRLASKNGLKEAEIEKVFNGVEFRLDNLKQMDILSYSRCLNIDWVEFNDIVEFTQSQSVLIHQNIAYCGRVQFNNCSLPSLPCSTSLATSYDRKERKEMKLKWLTMIRMSINQSDVSSAANLIGLAESVELRDVRVGGNEFEEMMEKLIQMKSRRLKRMVLYYCPLVNHELKQKMEKNGVEIDEYWPTSPILLLCKPESRDFVLQLKENLDDKNCYIAMDKNIEEFQRRYDRFPSVLIVFIQHQIPEEVERDILFAQKKKIIILLVKLEADFHRSKALSSVFDSNPCLDFTDKRTNSEMTIDLNRTISSILDHKFIVISNAPGNQVEAIQIKQKFADEIGCPVFVNIELWKYQPRVVVVLLTDGYEESQQCKEMMQYARFWKKPKIIAVKLNNDLQPGDELNKIVRERTCICWTDETNFDTNFAKVKEEINARFAWW